MQAGEMSARMARPAGQADPPDHHITVVASAIAGHIADRDEGAIRRLVNDLEHGLGVWRVNPWRLIEHMAVTAIPPAERAPHA